MISVTKTVKRYGNSGGVYVPAGWIGGKVKIELMEEPPDTKRDILDKIPLEHVISAILYGSYARNEASPGSDIDVLLVVDDDADMRIPAELKKYDIQVKTVRAFRNALMHDPVFYKIIKDESVAIINHRFIDDLKRDIRKPYGIKKRIELIESSLSIAKGLFEAGENMPDLVYPIVMRLKEILIVECIYENKKYSTGMLKQEILKQGIALKEFSSVMNIYRDIRNGKRHQKYTVQRDTVSKLISFLERKIQNAKQKAREKGN